MNCSTLTITLNGMLGECLASIGGIKELWLIKHDDVNPLAEELMEKVDTADQKHTILPTDIVLKGDAKFLAYHFAKNQASLSTTTVDVNGMRNWENTLTMTFSRMEGRKHLEIEILAQGELDAIITDYNGRTWFIGNDGFLSAEAGAAVAQTGTAMEDLNGYTLTLTGRSGHLPFEVDRTGENEAEFQKLVSEPA